jgi:hypothetical protein
MSPYCDNMTILMGIIKHKMLKITTIWLLHDEFFAFCSRTIVKLQ